MVNDVVSASTTDKQLLCKQWETYVRGFADWKLFATLTFRDFVTRDQSEHMFRMMVQILNQDLYGNHYMRIVGHSYFSYVVGYEYQKRGALHLHALIDQRVNFDLLHPIWNKMAGWCWVEPVTDLQKVVSYISKYVVKDGDLWVWKQHKFKMPSFVPMWFSS
jgi:hypothetical protein